MNKFLTIAFILFTILVCILGLRWYVLTHIKLGLETEFYQEAIKYMRENKK